MYYKYRCLYSIAICEFPLAHPTSREYKHSVETQYKHSVETQYEERKTKQQYKHVFVVNAQLINEGTTGTRYLFLFTAMGRKG